MAKQAYTFGKKTSGTLLRMANDYRARKTRGQNAPDFSEVAQIFSQAYLAKAVDSFAAAEQDTSPGANSSEYTMPSGVVQIQGTYLKGLSSSGFADEYYAPEVGVPATIPEINRDGAYKSLGVTHTTDPRDSFDGQVVAYNGLEVPINSGDMVTVINVDGVYTIAAAASAGTPFCFFQVNDDGQVATDTGCAWDCTLTEIIGSAPVSPISGNPYFNGETNVTIFDPLCKFPDLRAKCYGFAVWTTTGAEAGTAEAPDWAAGASSNPTYADGRWEIVFANEPLMRMRVQFNECIYGSGSVDAKTSYKAYAASDEIGWNLSPNGNTIGDTDWDQPATDEPGIPNGEVPPVYEIDVENPHNYFSGKDQFGIVDRVYVQKRWTGDGKDGNPSLSSTWIITEVADTGKWARWWMGPWNAGSPSATSGDFFDGIHPVNTGQCNTSIQCHPSFDCSCIKDDDTVVALLNRNDGKYYIIAARPMSNYTAQNVITAIAVDAENGCQINYTYETIWQMCPPQPGGSGSITLDCGSGEDCFASPGNIHTITALTNVEIITNGSGDPCLSFDTETFRICDETMAPTPGTIELCGVACDEPECVT